MGERRLVIGGSAAERIEAIRSSIQLCNGLLVVSPTIHAAKSLIRDLLEPGQSALGVEAITLYGLAQRLALPILAKQKKVPIEHVSEIAVAAGIVSTLHEQGGLGRYEAIADKPGLAHALARTLQELRMQGVTEEELADEEPDLARVFKTYMLELASAGLADRAQVYAAATEAASTNDSVIGRQTVLHDIVIRTRAEGEFVAAVAARAPKAFAVAPSLDTETIAALERSLPAEAEPRSSSPATNLARAQVQLFDMGALKAEPDSTLEVFSAPGENREAVEIARRILQVASDGVAFDQIAVIVRRVEHYRSHLVEACRRAGIPLNFARGSTRPDPSGRALLALMDCALGGLSASRFAEYLSLGVAPRVESGAAPPGATDSGDRFHPGDDYPGRARSEGEPAISADEGKGFSSPKRWERLLVDAAVLGGVDRWHRRLDGLKAELELRISAAADPSDPEVSRARTSLQTLENLRAFALPIVGELAELPAEESWGFWIEHLGAIASRAIRDPSRVLQVLSELQPMAEIENVPLLVVRQVLATRLGSVVDAAPAHRLGAVFVGSPSDVRGLAFDVVFVPGLAEKMFPPKVLEDPILLDRHRVQIASRLATNESRLVDERLALGVAIGSARKRLLVSYPRIDSDQARPRVPSFYALELFRAAEGRLPGFAELAARASEAGRARMRWPAPEHAQDAIDEAEFDLAVLEGLLHSSEESKGAARYLLETNAHLARALRFRGRRWLKKWSQADGIVAPGDEASKELEEYRLDKRPYSATALQTFASCPYRFYLRSILRLEPRDVIEPIEELDPLQRGSLIHDVQFRVLRDLKEKKRLPLRERELEDAEAQVVATLKQVADQYRDDLAPAIERVWVDGVALLEKDLKRWLRGLLDSDWVPEHFELAFGLPNYGERDAASKPEPLHLSCGIQFRGSIDLVERDRDKIRATDYKTGKKPPNRQLVISGGEILQPVLYAMALEELFEGAEVDAGRLSYCTERGGFSEEVVPLDSSARTAAELVVATINESLESGFLPAAPRKDACGWCDYQSVCGPLEEFRTGRKNPTDLIAITHLRNQP